MAELGTPTDELDGALVVQRGYQLRDEQRVATGSVDGVHQARAGRCACHLRDERADSVAVEWSERDVDRTACSQRPDEPVEFTSSRTRPKASQQHDGLREQTAR